VAKSLLVDIRPLRTQMTVFAVALQVYLITISAGFAAQAFAGSRHVWLLYVLVAFQSLVGAVNAPARRTFMPRLLPPDQMPAGAAPVV
jgi:MFS family permease